MNRKILIAIAVALGILIIIISVLLLPQQSPIEPEDTNPTPTRSAAGNKTQSTYQEFLNSGRSEVCTFTATVNGQSSSGTVYAAQGKIRGSFIVPYSGGTFQQHLLVDSYMAYLWTNLDGKGIKFAVEETDANANILDQLNNDPGSSYRCRDWKTDLAVFDIPSNVVFVEVNENTFPSSLLKVSPTSVPTPQISN